MIHINQFKEPSLLVIREKLPIKIPKKALPTSPIKTFAGGQFHIKKATIIIAKSSINTINPGVAVLASRSNASMAAALVTENYELIGINC